MKRKVDFSLEDLVSHYVTTLITIVSRNKKDFIGFLLMLYFQDFWCTIRLLQKHCSENSLENCCIIYQKLPFIIMAEEK